METPKPEKRTHSDVESDSSPESQQEKRREMATRDVTSEGSIQEQFNSLSGMNSRLLGIEKLVTEVSSKLAKLSLLDNLEQLATTTQATVQSLSSSLDQVRTLAQTAVNEVARCDLVIKELCAKTKQIDILKERMVQAEAYSRRDNLIFEGILEVPNEDCQEKILDILVKDLKIPDARERIKFTRVHRLGGRIPNRNRPVIAKFHYFQDRQLVWNARRKLKPTPYWISEDFPIEIRNRRQVLYPIYVKAMKMGNLQASLVADRLFLNRQMYTVDTLHRLPQNLQLQNTSLRIENDIVFFFNRSSPLSNFFPAPVTIDGIKYHCSEQYYQSTKAEILGDHGTAMKIMVADDPLQCKQLGDRATRTKQTMEKWDSEKINIMEKANMHKLEHNEHLKAVLLSTGNRMLAEASPKDTYWGIALSMSDKRKADRQQWTGQNKLGEVLMKVRTYLQEKL